MADKQLMRLDEKEAKVVRLWRAKKFGRFTILVSNSKPTDVIEERENTKL